jgi:Flp pilus assembly protein TadG
MLNKRNGMLKDEHGSVAVEAAFLFPIVLMLLIMAADTVSYFSAIRKLSASAATAADLLANAGETVDVAQLTGIANLAAPSGISAAMPAGTGITFQAYQIAGDFQAARWEFMSDESNYCGSPRMDFSSLATDDADVLVVGACGNWTPHTFSVLGMGPLNITQYSVMRPKNSLTTLCSDCY